MNYKEKIKDLEKLSKVRSQLHEMFRKNDLMKKGFVEQTEQIFKPIIDEQKKIN